MKTEVESLVAEVERQANARSLEIIDRILARRPNCRRIAALRVYVEAKIIAHRQKKRERYYEDVTRPDRYNALRGIAKMKRVEYYTTDCDCGYCKIVMKPSVILNESFAELRNGL